MSKRQEKKEGKLSMDYKLRKHEIGRTYGREWGSQVLYMVLRLLHRETLQKRIGRLCLGTKYHTINEAIRGELGWITFEVLKKGPESLNLL